MGLQVPDHPETADRLEEAGTGPDATRNQELWGIVSFSKIFEQVSNYFHKCLGFI